MVLEQECEVKSELLPFIRVYTNGVIERLYKPLLAPPSPDGGANSNVSSKDIIISPNVSARIYLPNQTSNKLPILVYFHGGGFCIESAYSTSCHEYINTISSQANALVISVEYRLAPEHPLPAAYEDSWSALQWVASHFEHQHNEKYDPWLITHGDFNRLYIGGFSSGANISHHMAMRANSEELNGGVKILGVFLTHPYFLGSEPVGSEPVLSTRELTNFYKTWMFINPGLPDGFDHPWINPFGKNAPCLGSLGCRRLLVCVASKDELRDRGVHYYEYVKESGWKGESWLFEVQGEDHGFHIFNPQTENAKNMFNRLAEFLQAKE